MIQIKCRFSARVLFEANVASLKIAVEAAVTARANLDGANLARAYLAGANLARATLDGANLAGAYLAGANLARANLARANLDGANLDGANLARAYLAGANLARATLDGANLAGANLAWANLAGAKVNWQSHDLIAEILWRAAAGDPAKEQLAAWIGRKREWCWDQWINAEHPCRDWAIDELRKLAQKDDRSPEFLRKGHGR